ESERRPDMPAATLATLLYVLFALLLLIEPDIGQTLLVSLIAAVLFLLAGRPLRFLALVGTVPAVLLLARAHSPYVRLRLEHFLHPASGEGFQTDRALQSFIEGGLFGKGPGEGTIKTVLPDAHTDFVFAVIAEEYGACACMLIAALFALIAAR